MESYYLYLFSAAGALACIVICFLRSSLLSMRYTKELETAIEPKRRDDGSTGYDLFLPMDITVAPLDTVVIDTGIVLEMPCYLQAIVCEKSSLALSNSVQVRAGLIDPNYRGSIGVIVFNPHPEECIELMSGDAIAQLVFQLAIRPELVYSLTVNRNTERGTRGFGGLCWNT